MKTYLSQVVFMNFKVWCLIGFCSISQFIFAQPKGRMEGKLFIQNFAPNDYDAEAQNWDIYQESSGLIYVANTGGFLIYDGTTWRRFRPSNDGLPLFYREGSDGRVYTGGTDFFGYLAPDSLGFTRFHSLASYFPENYEIGFLKSATNIDKTLWTHNQKDLISWDGEKIEIKTCPTKIKFIVSVSDQIFIDTQNGVYSLSNNSIEETSWSKEIVGLRAALTIGKDKMLLMTYNHGIFILEKEVVTPWNGIVHKFLKKHFIHSAVQLPDGNIAVATKTAGVLIFDVTGKPLWRLCKQTGMQDDNVIKLFLDKESNLWMANNRGISYVKYPIEFTYFDVLEEGLATIEEFQVVGDQLFLGTFQGTYQVHSIDPNDVLSDRPYPSFTKLPGSIEENFALGKVHEKLLFGGADKLSLYNGKVSRPIVNRTSRELITSRINPDVVYAGFDDGVEILIFNNGELVERKDMEMPAMEFRGIAETQDGNLWLTTMVNGAFFLELDREFNKISLAHFSVEDGLPSDRDNLVYNVEEKIYFTSHKGIFKFDSLLKKFKPDSTFGDIYGNRSRFIYSFHHDGKVNAWLNAFDKRETGHATKLADGSYDLDVENFHIMSDFQIYDIMAAENGPVWFGGSDALVRYEKVDSSSVTEEYHAKIRKVTFNEKEVVYGGQKINPEPDLMNQSFRNVRFDVAGLTYSHKRPMKYQFWLEGFDGAWSTWTNETFRIYTNLSSGTYRFKVQAINERGQLSSVDFYEFSIKPFWYETWWFRSATAFATIVFIIYIIQFFSQRKLIKKVEEMAAIRQLEKDRDEAIILEKQKGIQAMITAQEHERQRIAKDLHDGIVQEIGSNIIRWRNLFSSEKPDEKSAAELISSLEQSNGELRALSHQMMPKALSAIGVVSATEGLLETSLAPAGIGFEFENFGIEDRLPAQIEIPLYRITQELIQNIIKHSRASQVNVQIYKAGMSVNLVVEDNGAGIKDKNLNNGIGIQNIKSRLDPLKGEINFEASPQNGTLVTVKIPL